MSLQPIRVRSIVRGSVGLQGPKSRLSHREVVEVNPTLGILLQRLEFLKFSACFSSFYSSTVWQSLTYLWLW